MPAPLPPTLALTTTGKAQPRRRRGRVRATVDHPRARRGQAEFGQERQLQRLGNLVGERPRAVDDARAEPFQMREIVQRVQDGAAAAAQVRGRTHAVEQHRERALAVGRIVEERFARVDAAVSDPAPVEFGEKRPEPIRMFVVDGEGGGGAHRACRMHSFLARRRVVQRSKGVADRAIRQVPARPASRNSSTSRPL